MPNGNEERMGVVLSAKDRPNDLSMIDEIGKPGRGWTWLFKRATKERLGTTDRRDIQQKP